MTTTRDHSTELHPGAVRGVLAALLTATASAMTWANDPPEFNAMLLPSGPGGAGSRATSVAVGDVNGDGHADIIVGGQFNGATGQGPIPFVATALCNNEVIQAVTHEVLPDLGYGGTVSAISFPANAGDDTVALCAAGAVYDEGGQPLPAMYLKYDGISEVFSLPEPGASGELVGIMAEWTRAGLIIVVCGKSLGMDGTAQATVWECAFGAGDFQNPVITTTVLESLNPGANAEASAWFEGAEFRGVCGYSRDTEGRPQAVYWELDDNGWQSPVTLDGLPGGTNARARGALRDGTSNTLMVCGTAENGMDRMVPTVWSVDADGTQSVNALRLPKQFNQGRANGIIAILIGLLVPGEVSGANGSAAALWAVNQQGDSAVMNLNALARELPIGTTLRSANAILPFMEQGNVYAVVGNATNSRGVSRGYIGTVAFP